MTQNARVRRQTTQETTQVRLSNSCQPINAQGTKRVPMGSSATGRNDVSRRMTMPMNEAAQRQKMALVLQNKNGSKEGDSEISCEPLEGFALNKDDCDDEDPAKHPGQIDLCDGVDNNCNGKSMRTLLVISIYPKQ